MSGNGRAGSDAWGEDMREQTIQSQSDPQVASFLNLLKNAYEEAPHEEVATRHVSEIVAASRIANNGEGATQIAAPKRRLRRRARLALVAASLTLLLAGMLGGLASAGVIDLPEPLGRFFGDKDAQVTDVEPAERNSTPENAPVVEPQAPAGGTTPSPTPTPSAPASGSGDDPGSAGQGDRPDRPGGDSPESPGEPCDGEVDIPGIACGP